ncbi:MAG: 4-alpha-glucanotransferase [Balneolaceae bacterium]|nr:4-alpha-glucanotransferase [Balneolaceae bacterium]
MRFPRSTGTLVHPTSFPSDYGIGDLGQDAKQFISFLQETGQTIWQVLPLSPTGYGNSPYASYSAFAGNPYLISPDILVEKGLVTYEEAEKAKLPSTTKTEYEQVFTNKDRLFEIASKNFYRSKSAEQDQKLDEFKKANKEWLADYCLFMACSKKHNQEPWNSWKPGLAQRKSSAIKKFTKEHQDEIDYQTWLQFEFFNQWYDLKEYANVRDIRVVGDIPIFVDHNSADVWANPKYFEVDKQGNRQLVAGVPPDYFSETGQLWGNPLYKWDVLKKDGYSWWINRFEQMFDLFDAIRVDHFRGFDEYWTVAAEEETAENGEWRTGPAHDLFETIREELGDLPIIAEDLGVMTPGVEKLRDDFEFPGMRILQFAFGSDAGNSYLPHNFNQNCVVYTGTHDNDTTIGWYNSAPEVEKHRVREYTRSDGSEINWELIRYGMLSVADQAIFPLQDFMNLDAEHRMNIPGTAEGNWEWRFTREMLENIDREQIQYLVKMSNRNFGSGQ